jgi:mRNA interferase MazF
MARGEIWWVELDGRRPVVLLSPEEDVEPEDGAELRAMQIVEPAGVDLGGVGAEVTLGADEGLAEAGVVRAAFPLAGFIPCTWLVTVTRADLIERAGMLSPEKLGELTDVLRRSGIEDLSWA